MEDFEFSEEKLLEALKSVYFNGDRCFIQIGELKAALVPYEDVEVLESMEV